MPFPGSLHLVQRDQDGVEEELKCNAVILARNLAGAISHMYHHHRYSLDVVEATVSLSGLYTTKDKYRFAQLLHAVTLDEADDMSTINGDLLLIMDHENGMTLFRLRTWVKSFSSPHSAEVDVPDDAVGLKSLSDLVTLSTASRAPSMKIVAC